MKVIYIVLTAALIALFSFTFVLSTSYIGDDGTTVSINDRAAENLKKPDYHFVFIAQSTDDPFWQSVKKGALEAGKEFNAAVEFNGPRFTSIVEELKYLDIAIASRVDGIATHVLDEKQFTQLIDKAAAYGIPVVTMENDAKSSKRVSFIGTASFMVGSEAGKMLAEATGGKAKVAIILNSYSGDGEDILQNLKVLGFKDAAKDFADIEIKTVQSSRMGMFSAEEITKEILSRFPDVNAVFCTNSKDTLGAVEVVVDANRVGDITIIGYGDLPDILGYVEKGVVYGTVVGNPVKIGYESVKALIEVKKKNRTSSYVDTGVYSVTRKNIAAYKSMAESKKGQGRP